VEDWGELFNVAGSRAFVCTAVFSLTASTLFLRSTALTQFFLKRSIEQHQTHRSRSVASATQIAHILTLIVYLSLS
jgi:hypothetical protein